MSPEFPGISGPGHKAQPCSPARTPIAAYITCHIHCDRVVVGGRKYPGNISDKIASQISQEKAAFRLLSLSARGLIPGQEEAYQTAMILTDGVQGFALCVPAAPGTRHSLALRKGRKDMLVEKNNFLLDKHCPPCLSYANLQVIRHHTDTEIPCPGPCPGIILSH